MKEGTIKEGVSRFTFCSALGFKARTDATVDPHEDACSYPTSVTSLEKNTHDAGPIEVSLIVREITLFPLE